MKKFAAILIASLVLLTNLGLTISSHLCGGKMVETGITIAGQNLACGMAEMEIENPIAKIPNSFSPLPCCSNIQTLFDVEDRYNSKVKADFSVSPVLIPLLNLKPLINYCAPLVWQDYREYGPPKIIKDFQVAFQVFRI